jgi:hypothetical protein
MNLLERFVHLFRGRGDAHGSWPGGAVREPLEVGHFHRHLTSPTDADWIGVYNVIGERCSWGAVDIDYDDHDLATNIRRALHRRDIPAWTERTTRGWHVWVFPADRLVEASVMRRALTAACLAVSYSPKEVFPKQDRATGGKLGNYVRLPCNGVLSTGGHTPRLFEGMTRANFEAYLVQMDEDRAETEALVALDALLPRPQAVDISVDYSHDLYLEPILSRLPGLVFRIWRDGPLPGSDRSNNLVHLAHLMAAEDVDPQEALAVIRSCDQRWGKGFLDRGKTGEDIIQRILEKAYA